MRKRRGFILATVFFLLVVLIFLDASLFKLVPTELNYASRLRQDTEAYYAATAGVKHSLAWLKAVTAWGNPTGASFNHIPFNVGAGQPYSKMTVTDPGAAPYNLHPNTPPAAGPSPTDDTYFPPNLPALVLDSTVLHLENDWTANVTIFPDKQTPPHPALSGGNLVLDTVEATRPPCYIIVACAFQDFNHDGKLTPSLGERFVVRAVASVVQGTFARYAYFVDQWGADAVNGLFPYEQLPAGKSFPVFGGPVHTNDVPFLAVPGGTSYYAEDTSVVAPSFGSDLTIAGKASGVPGIGPTYDGIAWVGGNIQDGSQFSGTSVDRLPFAPPTGTMAATAVPGRYERTFARGQDAIRFVDRIELPTDSNSVALAAWGVADLSSITPPAPDEVFVPYDSSSLKPKGGAVISGATKQCLLDVVNSTSTGQGPNLYNAPVPTSGASAVKVVHANQIVYVSSTSTFTEVDYTTGTVSASAGETYSFLSTDPASGGVPTQFTRLVQTGSSSTSVEIPQGANVHIDPNAGGPVIPLSTGYTTETRTIPLFGTVTETDYNVTGVGPATYPGLVANSHLETQTIYGTYNPTDVILETKDQALTFKTDYLGHIGASNVYFVNGLTGYDNVVLQPRQTLVAHQSRGGPTTYDRWEVLSGTLNGAYEAQGDVSGLEGWNRGPKTIQAELRTAATASACNIVITGPLRQFNLSQGQLPSNFDNELGLVGRNIRVDVPAGNVDMDPSGAGGPSLFFWDHSGGNSRPLYFYTALLALGGGFETVFQPTGAIGSSSGQLVVIGSVVQKTIGGLYNGTGWSSAYRYDPYLTVGPPPAYPVDSSYIIYHYQVQDL